MRVFHLIILILISYLVKGQGSLELGLMPSLNFNKKLPKDWAINFKAEGRQALQDEKSYLQTDISLLTSRKVGFSSTLALGYLLRVPNGKNLRNRLIQQYIVVNRLSALKLSHRFGTDQTFGGHEAAVYRFRYRIAAELPLNGHSTDPHEFFLKLSNEYVNSLEDSAYDLEIRGLGFLGYVLNPGAKLEFGLDYRIGSFLHQATRQRTWLAVNLYQSF
ncbi:DUF2490 domain-containing protein [Jiulongibacter sediminis]|uniref:DUF2490 domain-containing protein n=1 Tax=Jiulongibacter sediminis TaxID=1605367 RepID=A0A0P7BZ26_9BACT|nr:DUF2490 domain-containing protein [Jiulongibacter sediminis]KPM47400.1 hypothetical protein AFM12_14700 [Jiulongibacter sediminis]TBX22980.1 hypothetical protein TK44_14710 [Jiulongibacter sediminis]